MIGPERLAAGERAEVAGDYIAAAAAYPAVAGLPDDSLASQAYFCLGRVSWRQSRFDASLAAFENALALAARRGDDELVARVENGMGAVHYARGDYDLARRYYSASLARTQDDAMRGKITLNLGVIENIENRYEAARARYEEAFRLFMGSGDLITATLALSNRGMVEADLGLWEEADGSFLAALKLASEAGMQEQVAKNLVNRSEVLIERGELPESIGHCDRALDIYSAVGDEVGRGEALRWRARALHEMGELVAAERSAGEALHIAMRCGARLLEAEASRDLGVLRGLLGDRAGGMKQLQRAQALFEELGAPRDASEVAALLLHAAPARVLAHVDGSNGKD